jgi:hypothetical protein
LTGERQLISDLIRLFVQVVTKESLQPVYVKLWTKNACRKSLLQLSAFLGIHLEAVEHLRIT